MCGGIDPARHPAKYDKSTSSKVAGEALRHTCTVRRWMPGADNCNSRFIYDFRATFQVKHEWRVVDFQQPSRILRIASHNNSSTLFLGAVELGSGQLKRLA